MGHQGLVYRDGFHYAYASFYVITIPFTGVMFLKRQWMLGKRSGYVTPNDATSWTFGIPSIWAWQILFWVLGTGMIWFLAYKMEMSTVPEKEIEILAEDIGDLAPGETRA